MEQFEPGRGEVILSNRSTVLIPASDEATGHHERRLRVAAYRRIKRRRRLDARQLVRGGTCGCCNDEHKPCADCNKHEQPRPEAPSVRLHDSLLVRGACHEPTFPPRPDHSAVPYREGTSRVLP